MSLILVPGAARYKGDVSLSILDDAQLVGPTTYGSVLVPAQSSYDPQTDVTTVRFRNAAEEDYA